MLTSALAAVVVSAAISQYDANSTRDRVLAEPRPWPANRVDSPDRIENDRLWYSRWPIGNRTPLAEQAYGRISAATYGAPASLDDAVIFARINHAAVAISPWRPFTSDGFQEYRTAQNIWLREQGWVLGVRTHVNDMYMVEAETAEITPRATIEIHGDPSAPSFPKRMRDDLNEDRIFKPHSAPQAVRFAVVEPVESDTDLAEATPEEEADS